MSDDLNPVAVLLVLAPLIVFVDARCLIDLAHTPDERLRGLPRLLWAVVIVISFPLGPILYWWLAKRPGNGV